VIRVTREGVVALVLALGSAGCPPPPPKSALPNGQAALDRMKATYACANGIQGEGKIDHFSPKGRIRGDVLVFAVNPARVRVDVVSSFGAMPFVLTSNGTEFQMFDLEKKQFLHGPASACNLARLTRVPMPGHVLVSLMRGEAPLLVHDPSQAKIAWDGGHYVVAIESKHAAHQRLFLEVYDDDWDKDWREQRMRVTFFETSQAGVVLYTADLDDHQLAHTAPPRQDPDGLDPDIPPSGGVCDVELPRSIRMKVPNSEDDVMLSYEKVSFNPPIPQHAFAQPVPGGATQAFVNCE